MESNDPTQKPGVARFRRAVDEQFGTNSNSTNIFTIMNTIHCVSPCKNPCASMSVLDEHSYEDVMDLISQAKEVSASIDKTMKDMKHHFVEDNEDDCDDDKVTKTVRFVPDSCNQMELIEYPSPDMCQRLYYNDEEYQAQLDQLQADLEQWDEEDPPESKYFTSRGLERRTVEGAAQRTEWRTQCRDRVLDEQDRQWMELPIDEPVDEEAIALICMATTRDAREAAYQQGLHDEQVVYGAVVTSQDKSTGTLPTYCESSSVMGESTSLINWSEVDVMSVNSGTEPDSFEEEDSPLNTKGRCVYFPNRDRMLKQVFYIPHAETQEEREAYWYPNWTEEEAKEMHQEVIAHLATPKSNPLPRGESLRGLETRTPLAEAALKQIRMDLILKVYTPELMDDAELLAKQCQRITARAKKEARARAMMDQRAVKEDEEKSKYNKKKKFKSTSSSSSSSRTKKSSRSKEGRREDCCIKRRDTKSVRKSLKQHLSKSLAAELADIAEDAPLRRSNSLPSLRELDFTFSCSFFLPSPKRTLPSRHPSCPAKLATPSKTTDDIASVSTASTSKTSSSLTRRLSQSQLAIPEDLFDVDTTDGDSVTFELPRRKPRRESTETVSTVASNMSWDERDSAPWNIKPYSFDYNKAAVPRRPSPDHSSSKKKASRRLSSPSFDYNKMAVPSRPKQGHKKKPRRASLPDLLARIDHNEVEPFCWNVQDEETESSSSFSDITGRSREHRRF